MEGEENNLARFIPQKDNYSNHSNDLVNDHSFIFHFILFYFIQAKEL